MTQERFWSKADKSGDCWLWTAGRHRQGYGLARVAGRKVLAHRAAYAFTNGPIPKGLHVLHRCDTHPRVRPDHLWLGTHADNMADAASKGRVHVGEDHRSAKLTEPQVVEILESAQSHAELGRRFGVDESTVCNIRKKRVWRHIDIPAAYYEGRSS